MDGFVSWLRQLQFDGVWQTALLVAASLLCITFHETCHGLAALALVLARMKRRDWARRIAGGLCVAAAVLFVLYYPALSGLPIPAWWADALEVLPSFGFY